MTRRSFALLCTGGALLVSFLAALLADAYFAAARA
jgi:hypothetical protein